LPKSQEKREALALEIGADGFLLLDALDAPTAPTAARDVAMVRTLRDVWRIHYARDDGRPRWRAGSELPPVGERVQAPYDPEMHYSTKRQLEWSGYKVHITETCDDDAAHVITHVKTCPAMEQDMTSTAEIHERLAAKELLPDEHFVDSAYIDAALLVDSRRDHDVSLEGPACRVGNPARGKATTCPGSRSTGSASGSPALRARWRYPGGSLVTKTEAHASTPGSAAPIAGRVPPGNSVPRRKNRGVPSTSIHARSTRR
jgi:hypothetical protein